MDSEIVAFGQLLTIDNVVEVKELLSNAIKKNTNIIFQAEKITQVDAAGLQCILSFTKKLTELNLTWEWQEPSMVIIHVASVLGMNNLLKLSS